MEDGRQIRKSFLEEEQEIIDSLQFILRSNTSSVSLLECHQGKYRYIHSNSIQNQWLGRSDLIGKSILEIYTEDQAQILIANFEKALAEGEVVNYEISLELHHGYGTVASEVTPIYSRTGREFIVLVSKDITEYKKIEKRNEVLNKRFKAMFDQHSAMKLVFNPKTGQIVAANKSACDFYGYTEEELRTMTVQELNLDSVDIEKESEICRRGQIGEGMILRSMPHKNRKGEIYYLDIYSNLIFDGESELRYSIFFDVTERDELRRQILEEKELLRVTLNSIGDAVVSTDSEGRIRSLNPVAEKITGWKAEEASGRKFEEVFILKKEEQEESVINPIEEVLRGGQALILEPDVDLITASGQAVSIADSAAPIKTEDGEMHGVVMVFRDVGKEKEYKKKIEYASYNDYLTGLKNRRYIEKIMLELDKEENLPMVVIMADLNGLKITNDLFGHEAGDQLLKSAADNIKRNIKENHVVARWGGDEFVIFMPSTQREEAEEIMDRIKEEKLYAGKNALSSSISMGYSVKFGMNCSMDQALRVAEESMYRYKLLEGKSYRNSIVNSLLVGLFENSNETEVHSKRLEDYSREVGKRMNLPAREINDLSLLALLHDIGKIGIDSNILKKPGPLTEDEWIVMKTHPEIGYRVAKAIPELAAVSNLILSHHERWDGQGYPSGLAGEEIPLASRILAVVDAYDVMTNDRTYKKAISSEEALEEIERNSGTQFDPKVVELFVDMVKNME